MKIKHLVISGGGPTGFITYGAIRQLHKKGFWKLENITSIYGCSIGAMIGVILSLGYDWNWLDDYFTKRPWHQIFAIEPEAIFNIVQNKGLLGNFFEQALGPLLTAKGLTIKSTLKDLYTMTHIDIHIFSTDINPKNFSKVDISAKTHPNLSIIKAIAMSGSIPIIFQPICENNKCYIDGGLLNNFPLNDCLQGQNCNPDEVLAFKNIWCRTEAIVKETTSIFEYIFVLLRKLQFSLDTVENQKSVKYTVRCITESLDTFDNIIQPFKDENIRLNLINKGVNQADLFIAYLKSS